MTWNYEEHIKPLEKEIEYWKRQASCILTGKTAFIGGAYAEGLSERIAELVAENTKLKESEIQLSGYIMEIKELERKNRDLQIEICEIITEDETKIEELQQAVYAAVPWIADRYRLHIGSPHIFGVDEAREMDKWLNSNPDLRCICSPAIPEIDCPSCGYNVGDEND
jgi:hypothetical protein